MSVEAFGRPLLFYRPPPHYDEVGLTVSRAINSEGKISFLSWDEVASAQPRLLGYYVLPGELGVLCRSESPPGTPGGVQPGRAVFARESLATFYDTAMSEWVHEISATDALAAVACGGGDYGVRALLHEGAKPDAVFVRMRENDVTVPYIVAVAYRTPSLVCMVAHYCQFLDARCTVEQGPPFVGEGSLPNIPPVALRLRTTAYGVSDGFSAMEALAYTFEGPASLEALECLLGRGVDCRGRSLISWFVHGRMFASDGGFIWHVPYDREELQRKFVDVIFAHGYVVDRLDADALVDCAAYCYNHLRRVVAEAESRLLSTGQLVRTVRGLVAPEHVREYHDNRAREAVAADKARFELAS